MATSHFWKVLRLMSLFCAKMTKYKGNELTKYKCIGKRVKEKRRKLAKISLPNTMHWSVFSLQICSPKSLKQIRCTIFRMSFVLFIWFGSVQTEIRFIFRGSPPTLFLPLLCNPDEGTSPAYTHLHQDTHIVIEMNINEITAPFNLNAEIWWWVGSIQDTLKKIFGFH